MVDSIEHWIELEQRIIECIQCPRLVSWREQVARERRRAYRDTIYWGKPVPGFGDYFGRVLVVGEGDVARALIRNTEADKTARIVGVLWPRVESHPGEVEGYPVLGSIDKVKQVLSAQKVELLLVATSEAWYSYFIEALASRRLRHLTVKWVQHDLLAQKAENLPDVIPLQDFTV